MSTVVNKTRKIAIIHL